MGLGSAQDRSLSAARELAAKYRVALLDGRDPLAVRDAGRERQAPKITFGDCLVQYVEAHEAGWGNRMWNVLKGIGYGNVTVHGFRSAFRDWCGEETSFPREICEAALAHTLENKVEAAYRRGDALEKRRALMEAWASFCL